MSIDASYRQDITRGQFLTPEQIQSNERREALATELGRLGYRNYNYILTEDYRAIFTQSQRVSTQTKAMIEKRGFSFKFI